MTILRTTTPCRACWLRGRGQCLARQRAFRQGSRSFWIHLLPSVTTSVYSDPLFRLHHVEAASAAEPRWSPSTCHFGEDRRRNSILHSVFVRYIGNSGSRLIRDD